MPQEKKRYVSRVDLVERTLFSRIGALTIFPLNFETGAYGCQPDAMICTDLKGNRMATGTVKFFNATKGFGFIEQGNGQPDVFVHISAVERAGMRTLAEGQKVNFDVVKDNRNGKSSAENLQAA
ncbi:cold shock CspA family protein [Mesorhizobium shonense]|uniref:Cold shock CspA family protein n=2 Tax=Phyllobacteriaceae TaxID=69277 RepID=A0ABV2HX42_9HYPH